MAKKLTKNPVALALIGAGVSVVVFFGIVIAPKTQSCMKTGLGISYCLKDSLPNVSSLSDKVLPTFLLKQDVVNNETPILILENSLQNDRETSEISDVLPKTKVDPEIELVRIAPDGSIIIIGSGEPKSVVEVYVNDKLLKNLVIDKSGAWVFVPEDELAVGGNEIIVKTPNVENRSNQANVIIISEDKSIEPVVVMGSKEEIENILLDLDKKAKEISEIILTDEKLEAVEVVEPEIAEVVKEVVEENIELAKPIAPEPASRTIQTEVAEVELDEPEKVEQNPIETILAPVPATKIASPVLEIVKEKEPEIVEPEVPNIEPPIKTIASQPVQSIDFQKQKQLASNLENLLIVEQVDIAGRIIIFAGAGTENATIRLFVNDNYIKETIVKDGLWLIEAKRGEINSSLDRLRFDMLAFGNTKILARVEVGFGGDYLGVSDKLTKGVNGKPIDPEDDKKIDSVSIETLPPLGTRVAVPHENVLGADSYNGIYDRYATVPILSAKRYTDIHDQKYYDGKLTVVRGDNLWNLARSRYGAGYRYRLIYDANRGKIKDPHWIYPGQTFNLPSDYSRSLWGD